MLFRKYTCNKCGKEFDDDECYENPFFIKQKMKYGSNYDGQELSFYLCESCLEKFIKDCNDNWEIEVLSE